MTTFPSLIRSLMAKKVMLICLFLLSFLLFLVINIAAKLSQNILNDIEIDSKNLNLDMKLFNYTPCEVASK